MQLISPDWDRETKSSFLAWEPSKSLIRTLRLYQKHRASNRMHSKLLCKWYAFFHKFWSVITGADIPLNSLIGGGLLLPHPNGIVIHPKANIGINCLIFQQVTIGGLDDTGLPTIGAHVDIGAGAKIIGPVTIGDHAKIGANAVVLCDVPAGKTAVGVPARVIR